jgi:hypothetical protein
LVGHDGPSRGLPKAAFGFSLHNADRARSRQLKLPAPIRHAWIDMCEYGRVARYSYFAVNTRFDQRGRNRQPFKAVGHDTSQLERNGHETSASDRIGKCGDCRTWHPRCRGGAAFAIVRFNLGGEPSSEGWGSPTLSPQAFPSPPLPWTASVLQTALLRRILSALLPVLRSAICVRGNRAAVHQPGLRTPLLPPP